MVHDGPLGEGLLVAQVAQVVAVAPDLLGQLRVADGGAGHIVVLRHLVLVQPAGKGADVVQHLHTARGVVRIVRARHWKPPVMPDTQLLPAPCSWLKFGTWRCRAPHSAALGRADHQHGRTTASSLGLCQCKKAAMDHGLVCRSRVHARSTSGHVIKVTWGTRRCVRMRYVHTSSGVSLSAVMAAAKAPGPWEVSTYSRLSGSRLPR